MPLRFGINGLGRVGRALLRVARGREDLELAAVNDAEPPPVLARLLARDSVHGPFAGEVRAAAGSLVIEGRRVPPAAAWRGWRPGTTTSGATLTAWRSCWS